MTTIVKILSHDGITRDAAVLYPDHPASKAVRATFNPSGRVEVEDIKTLAAAFIARADQIASVAKGTVNEAEVGRAIAVAKTNMQQASMWAVFGATAGL